MLREISLELWPAAPRAGVWARTEQQADGLDSLMALLPTGDSQRSVEPFSLNASPLDGLTEKPAKHEAAYLVDMARVEALDTMGESRKAVEILDRHV